MELLDFLGEMAASGSPWASRSATRHYQAPSSVHPTSTTPAATCRSAGGLHCPLTSSKSQTPLGRGEPAACPKAAVSWSWPTCATSNAGSRLPDRYRSGEPMQRWLRATSAQQSRVAHKASRAALSHRRSAPLQLTPMRLQAVEVSSHRRSARSRPTCCGAMPSQPARG